MENSFSFLIYSMCNQVEMVAYADFFPFYCVKLKLLADLLKTKENSRSKNTHTNTQNNEKNLLDRDIIF